MKRLIKVALSVGAVLMAGIVGAQGPSPETLIAHRGESIDAPENTLPAYRMAVERGFGFECDIYLSRDGRLFTFHDGDLRRTTAGANTNKCTEVDWERTVSKVNVGGWGKWKGSKFDPTRPALFSEVLELARDGRWIYVEVKGNNPAWVPYIKAELAKSSRANPRNVLFISFGEQVCAELKRQLPDYQVYWLTGCRKSFPWEKNRDKSIRTPAEIIAKLREIGADGVNICFEPEVVDAAYVSAVKAAGFSFHVWTVDEPERARRAFAAGVDTLTTNRAKYLLEAMAQDGKGAAAPLQLDLARNGAVHMAATGARIDVRIYHAGWSGESAASWSLGNPIEPGVVRYDFMRGMTRCATGFTTLRKLADGRAQMDAVLASEIDQTPEQVVLAVALPGTTFGGCAWRTSVGTSGVLPKEGGAHPMTVLREKVTWVEFAPPAGQTFRLAFPAPTDVYLQDNHQWDFSFTLRINSTLPAVREFNKGAQRAFSFTLSSPSGVTTRDRPLVTVARGADWIPLDYIKEIEAGSALDFTNQGFLDAPAGKHGWLKAVDGHFEFEKLPGRKQRFYGINICMAANFPTHEFADVLATRIARLGYNAVRIHHYEMDTGVIKDAKDGLTLNPEMTDRLDYFLARLYEKGIYATTDFITLRPVTWRAIGIDRDGRVPLQVYKNLILIHEPAFQNWRTFARNVLEHVNPYTKRRLADEPAMPLLSLINEGSLFWCWHEIRGMEPMKTAWRTWLAEKRAADPQFAPGVPDDSARVETRTADGALAQFMTEKEHAFVVRARELMREMSAKALLTNQNCAGRIPPVMAVRNADYDYVDDHFYVDHPQFLVENWRLPSKCPNTNPVKSTIPPVACAFGRLPTKPFTITEWNFSGPGMFRGVGGILTGALSALQDWDGLWRFCYSHGLENMRDRQGRPDYFETATDPLGQASDRASICLFLRGDLDPLADAVAQTFTPADVADISKATQATPAWRDAAWQTRVGTSVEATPPAGWRTCEFAKTRENVAAPVALKPNSAIALDRARGSFVINTPKTAGGFTPSGALRAGAIAFDVGDVPATVWVSSLDGQPIAQSKRMLLTHLTDVQGDGTVYADPEKRILLNWGKYPPVVRRGEAGVRLAVERPETLTVWALATSGRRLAKVPAEVKDGCLVFTAAVKGPEGARMLYEIAR